MEAWRQWLLGGTKLPDEDQEQIYLTPTGLLMEGVITSLRLPSASWGLNE